jgi:hypothetical protein
VDGAFAQARDLAGDEIAAWLAEHTQGPARLGPLVPALARRLCPRLRGDPRCDHGGRHLSGQPHLPAARALGGRCAGALCRAAPGRRGAHGALVWDGAAWLLSFSPELFFETDAEAITAAP